jgi:MFS family permease
VAGLGTSVVHTTLLFQVYDLTGSPLHLGGLSLASGLATLVLPLAGGVIADRTDRRYVVLVAQTLAAVLGLGIGFLTFSDAIEVWQLYALAFGLAGSAAISSPARAWRSSSWRSPPGFPYRCSPYWRSAHVTPRTPSRATPSSSA